MERTKSPDRKSSNNTSNDGPSDKPSGAESSASANTPPKKHPMLKRFLANFGPNYLVLKLMVKGSIPPTIGIALFQAKPFADHYTALGFLVAITSVLGFAIMPRAKFLQTIMLHILMVCIAASLSLLMIYSSIQARLHTTPATSSSSSGPSSGVVIAPYNSSASAVCAVWLFFDVYWANCLRAKVPQFQLPVIVYSIFIIGGFDHIIGKYKLRESVIASYAPLFPTMKAGIAFVKSLMETFFTGFAISTGISLLIFPISSRDVVFMQLAGFVKASQGALKAQTAYMQSLGNKDMFRISGKKLDAKADQSGVTQSAPPGATEAAKLKAATRTLAEIHAKLHTDLPFAKRESAYGKLDAEALDEMFRLFRGILLPMIGMGSVVDIFSRIAERRGWNLQNGSDSVVDASNMEPSIASSKSEEVGQWNEIARTLHQPFTAVTESMTHGLEHALFTLELAKPPKTVTTEIDVEAQKKTKQPGEAGFSTHLASQIDEFYDQRKVTLKAWCEQKGIDLPDNVLSNSPLPKSYTIINGQGSVQHRRNHQQLYLILYMEFLLWSTGRAVLDLVRFADRKVEEGVMKEKRLVLPGYKRTRKWILGIFRVEDASTDHTPDNAENGSSGIVYTGDSFKMRRDPEHLPPTNIWQRFGNMVRGVSHFLGSPASAFGFRVACATLTIDIVNCLRDTQKFFTDQRLLWAMIMVAISMSVTAGSGIFGFFTRILGTTIAMCTSYVIWYVVNGHAAGVIVFLWVFYIIEYYCLVKYPRFVVVAMLSIVTQVLIIGYELQVQKLGVKVAESTGQPAYATYLLAPYRLATVIGGLFVAFLWTVFPYPITAHSELRKDLGAALYLLANFYSIINATAAMRIHEMEGDGSNITGPGRRLDKARHRVFAKEMALLAGLRQHSQYTLWEPTFGGKFPKMEYDSIIQRVQNILNYMSMIAFASQAFSRSSDDTQVQQTWMKDFSKLLASLELTSHEITSMISLLAAAISNGHPLPPYLKPPQPYRLSERLEALDTDILSINHIAEPGYAAFAVTQIASSLVSDELEKLITNVKELVGEVDFSYHVVSTAESLSGDVLQSEKGKTD